jgi:ribose transport system substrate-binding protein
MLARQQRRSVMAAGKDQGLEGGRRPRSARRAWLGIIAAAVALTMTVAGCSSSGDTGTAADSKAPSNGSSASAGGDSSAAVTEAKKIVAEWSAANSEWQGPTSAPAPKPGMRVALITCDQNAEGCARPARAQEVAAKLIGWKTTLFDGQGNPAKQLQAINAAIDAKFDAIILDLVDTRVTQEGIQRAIKAGIPMVSVANLSNEPSSIPDVSHDWVFAGELAAYYMIAKSEGKVNALVLLDNEFEVVKNGEYKGIMSVLEDKTKCPECKVTVKEFQIANLETQPGNHAVAALQQDPSINWVWCFDACMARAATQVLASGISTNAKGIGMNANAQNLQLIKDGQFQTMTIGNPYEWEAWAALDNLNRLLNGQQAVDQKIPVRIIDNSNMSDLKPEELKSGWAGGIDYVAKYKELWGVK